MGLAPAWPVFSAGTFSPILFVSGRYVQRNSLTTMMIVGRIVACTGLIVGLALYLVGIVNVVTFFGSTIFVGLGNGLAIASSNAGALSVRPYLAGSASGLSGALTVAGGSVLTSVAGTIVSQKSGLVALLSIMVASSALGLVAAFSV